MTDSAPPPSDKPAGNGQPKPQLDVETATARSRALAANLGAVVAIMMRSPEHRNATLSEIQTLVGPPLGLDQIAIVEARDPSSGIIAPVAAVLWALVSDKVDASLSNVDDPKPKLEPRDWRSGPIPWIITAVGHKAAVTQLLEQLVATRFSDSPPKIRVREKDGTSKIGLVRIGNPEADEKS